MPPVVSTFLTDYSSSASFDASAASAALFTIATVNTPAAFAVTSNLVYSSYTITFASSSFSSFSFSSSSNVYINSAATYYASSNARLSSPTNLPYLGFWH